MDIDDNGTINYASNKIFFLMRGREKDGEKIRKLIKLINLLFMNYDLIFSILIFLINNSLYLISGSSKKVFLYDYYLFS